MSVLGVVLVVVVVLLVEVVVVRRPPLAGFYLRRYESSERREGGGGGAARGGEDGISQSIRAVAASPEILIETPMPASHALVPACLGFGSSWCKASSFPQCRLVIRLVIVVSWCRRRRIRQTGPPGSPDGLVTSASARGSAFKSKGVG
jgi:hypothetical protein